VEERHVHGGLLARSYAAATRAREGHSSPAHREPFRSGGALAAVLALWNSSSIFTLNTGMSSGFRLVTMPWSTTTSSSTQCPPAFRISVFREGQEVRERPGTASASTSTQGPWQIEATGLPASKNDRTNATAFGIILSRSGFITPPGSNNASYPVGSARSSSKSTRKSSPNSRWFQALTFPCAGEMSIVCAPA